MPLSSRRSNKLANTNELIHPIYYTTCGYKSTSSVSNTTQAPAFVMMGCEHIAFLRDDLLGSHQYNMVIKQGYLEKWKAYILKEMALSTY